MKIRSVRPEFFTDPTMAQLDAMARLLYVGLWCYVDDDGRGEWLPKLIEGQIFPHEDVDIDALLEQCVRSGRVVRYTDGNREFFYIPTFTRYQKPNRKVDSKLPDPSECRNPSSDPAPTVREQRVRSGDAHAVEGEGGGVGEGGVEVLPTVVPRGPDGDETRLVETNGRGTDPWFDAAAIALDIEVTPKTGRMLGMIAAKARSGGHPPEEILRRVALHTATFNFPCTPGSVHKRWEELGSKVTTATPAQRKEVQRHLDRMHAHDDYQRLRDTGPPETAEIPR